MNKILLIQTAFLGDVVLATALIEKLHQQYPQAQLDFLLRKGNEALLKGHPLLTNLFVWDKKGGKYKNLFNLIKQVRGQKYDLVVNVQRFGATGLLTALSGAKQTVGFDKNPFSRFFSKVVPHSVTAGEHEVSRNHKLIAHLTDNQPGRPKLYPAASDFEKVKSLKAQPYICVAPASVWFTKQFPEQQWVKLLNSLPEKYTVYLIGAPADKELAERIMAASTNTNTVNLCGSLNLLQSAALMQGAVLNYVNDSGPMHLASSQNA
ncbi:MAG: glycosyltransferase family 9 protein, partial [Hymenobacteraceae bacterium]|nr:glycosyltransferase family 9 protein [Hymenobacteraceae bacterium]MDX5395443.1 glycosyltransferase family 9 protein [Hymenobacteraceae bacterium]MDX5442534.1 glycosyltransferase family 9 protein [Hymenobacteraceae bacterium]MDX5511492.1 glycosyltransferase family 9 protein [Hymenobacteraceae bacterium]